MSIVVQATVTLAVKCALFVPKAALGVMDCFLLEEVCSIAVGALVGLMDIFSLFLPVAESLVSSNNCNDASIFYWVREWCDH